MSALGGGPHSGAALADADRRHARTQVLLGVALGVLGTGLAVAFKARCGIPAGPEGQYLQWCYTDITPLWFAERLNEGAVPYLDHPVEYPPLTGLWMWLAALPSASMQAFFVWTSALLVVSGGIIGGLLARAVGVRRSLVFSLAPTLVVSGAVNWDLPSMALATAGLVAHRRGRDGWAGVWLGLGTAAKLWPALLLPGAVLGAGVLRGRARGWRTALAAVAVWALVNVPVLVVAPRSWFRFIELNRDRAAEWNSLWHILPRWLDVQVPVPTINAVGAVVTVAGLLVLLALAVRWDPPRSWYLVALPMVGWFLLTNKVYSPQFTLWLLPLLVLAAPPAWALVALFVTDVAVSLLLWPHLAQVTGLEGGLPAWPYQTAAVLRVGAIVAVCLLGWRRAARPMAPGRGQVRLSPARPTP